MQAGPFDFHVNFQLWWEDGGPSRGEDFDPDDQINFILPAGQTLVSEGAEPHGGGAWTYEGCTLQQVILDLSFNDLPMYHLEGNEWVYGPPSTE